MARLRLHHHGLGAALAQMPENQGRGRQGIESR